MKLIKYIISVLLIIGGVYFFLELNELNKKEETPITIKIPFVENSESENLEFKITEVFISIFTIGFLSGFLMALIQILSQKAEMISARSKLKKVQLELDNLRNQSIELEEDLISDEKIQFNEENEEEEI